MKKRIGLREAFLGTLVLLLAGASLAQTAPPEGVYEFDKAHTKIGFSVPHLVISKVEGHFNNFEGEISLGKNLASSSVKAKVLTNSVDTGNAERDDHLRSDDFFGVEKHPEMRFVSTRLKGTLKSFKMTGDLTIKGVTKRVTFDTRYLGTVVDGYGNQKVAFEATTRVNRKDFGLAWSSLVEAGPVVGDNVTIQLIIQGAKPIHQPVARGD